MTSRDPSRAANPPAREIGSSQHAKHCWCEQGCARASISVQPITVMISTTRPIGAAERPDFAATLSDCRGRRIDLYGRVGPVEPSTHGQIGSWRLYDVVRQRDADDPRLRDRVPSALAYLCYNRGVELIGANRSAPFYHLIPVFGSVLAIGFLGEEPRLFHLVGYALVLLGVFVAARR